MIILVLFAFLAGIVTILSPCILPILPIILTSSIAGKDIGKSRAVGVVAGFIASFTFFTLFLSTIVQLSGIPAETFRFLSIIVVGSLGVSMLIPKVQLALELLFSKLASYMPVQQQRSGFGGGLVIGCSVGLLWTPCVGPILASVISLAITGTVTFDTFLITLAYSLGTAIPMFLIILGGQKALQKVPWLLSNLGHIQKIFGIIMILTALGIMLNIDRTFQTYILKTFPSYGTGLTRFEDNTLIQKALETNNAPEMQKEEMGKPMYDLAEKKGKKAPEIIPGGAWFNSSPLLLSSLKGKVVLIDFWTYSCINCQRTIPYLRAWHESYKDKGLVIIGVHAPEFEFEKNEKNVQTAIEDFNLLYPIVQDNDFATWRAYNNRYWPAKYIIDKDGFIRYQHFGEGAYDETEKVIQDLLKEAGTADITNQIDNPIYQIQARTPELYLGYQRIEHLSSPERIVQNKPTIFSAPKTLEKHTFAFTGEWTLTSEYAHPKKDATLLLHFEAKDVFLVMRPTQTESTIRVYLDDVFQQTITITKNTLYPLLSLPESDSRMLKIEFIDSDTEIYAFTFG